MYSFYSVTTMTTISKGSCDVKIYWLIQTMKRDVYAMMQKYYFVFSPYIFTRSQYDVDELVILECLESKKDSVSCPVNTDSKPIVRVDLIPPSSH